MKKVKSERKKLAGIFVETDEKTGRFFLRIFSENIEKDDIIELDRTTASKILSEGIKTFIKILNENQ